MYYKLNLSEKLCKPKKHSEETPENKKTSDIYV